jgi:glycosyltransferase involved in cell wall biosynthesis
VTRVILFTDSDVFAGTERHMLDLARGLEGIGVEVKIACPTPSALYEKAPAQGLEVVPIQKGGTIDRPAIRTLSRLLKSEAIDVIHSHNGRTALSAAIAVRIAGRGACVTTQHFLQPQRLSRRGIAALASRIAHGWMSRETGHFLAISEAVCNGMNERGDAPRNRITVVHNGIVDPQRDGLRPVDEVRRDLGICPKTILIACAARLEAEKNVSALVSSMTRVRALDPSVCCVIAGEGSLEKDLLEQIHGAGLEQHVRLLGFRSDAIDLINACDLFVLPSLAEPFGLVLLEAMALGKPVVATDAGGPREIVVEGQTGLLVAPGSSEALGEAICGLLGRPAERLRFGIEGRRRFEEEFTASRMAERTLEAYRKALWRSSKNRKAASNAAADTVSIAGVR